MDPGEPDQCLRGQVRDPEAQQMPHPLGVSQRLAGGRDICPVHGDPRVDHPYHGLLKPGQARGAARAVGERLGLVPLAAGHGQ